jgi:hypothetical protein
LKRAAVILCAFTIIMPVVFISYISYIEMQEYKPKYNYTVTSSSYGSPVEILRHTTLEEKILVSGHFISTEYIFADINNLSYSNFKRIADINQEIARGEILAYNRNIPVYSPVNGLVLDIQIFDKTGYFKILSWEHLIFEAFVSSSFSKLEINKPYQISESITLTLVYLSNAVTSEGRKAQFKVEGGQFLYGQETVFEIPTGVIYSDVLAVPSNAVYQKEVNGPFFIRRVEKNGNVLEEVQVKLGISDGSFITITGVKEGWYCDPGYSSLMNVELGDKQ